MAAAAASGGGIVEPLLKPFEETAPPARYETLETSLARFMEQRVPIESDAELRRRERVMDELKVVFQQWVFSVCRGKGLSEELSRGAGGKIYTSGSYRLRVHEPGADIDSVGVGPKHCEREDFFASFKAALQAHPLVENLRPIESAAVPIMTFDMDGVNIDMLFAKLPLNAVPETVDIDDDNILHSVDEATEKSLNGPRVTNLIYKLVAHNYESFLRVLRVARVWGKRRGIYSNKMGYLGGVNFNILVALICQLYPRATPAYMLCKFFHIFAKWDWPSPAILCRPVDHRLGFEVWNSAQHLYGRAAAEHARQNLMPIVTPAYPAMNSAANVNPWTFRVIKDEFERASRVCKDIETLHLLNSELSFRKSEAELARSWGRLVEPSDFFAKYDTYLAINLLDLSAAAAPDEAQKGAGSEAGEAPLFDEFKAYISSRLRKFVERLGNLPFSQVHLFPKEFEVATAPIEGVSKAASYFVGVVEDVARLREGESLVLTHVWTTFWEKDVARFKRLELTLDVRLDHLKWSKLPEFVFGDEQERNRVKRVRARRRREKLEAENPQPDSISLDDLAKQVEAIVPPLPPDHKPPPDEPPTEPPGPPPEPLEETDLENEHLPKPAPGPAKPEPIGFHNFPSDLPKLGPVLPKWHPMAKKENRDPTKRKITIKFLPNSPEMRAEREKRGEVVDVPNPPEEEPVWRVFRAVLPPEYREHPIDDDDEEEEEEGDQDKLLDQAPAPPVFSGTKRPAEVPVEDLAPDAPMDDSSSS
ncbi:hypothetical protein CTAYLR_000302 [Chrysophaeum taylorii]|uniref:polynucleotide adenylyltransferase n=1 Tax=Chrysophaeum taylorii TaxID=2483200 RepID=A0AAD7UEJ1_9STRA|nr:hypothetical protein CTAYLR_000302 [Chrysophaeum taylorii]